ncbi:heparan-alpha-glucosaminide N-acetyltransferase domain-containing protein [Paludisphaera rhizosphaerae]|uniref:heparan-alpha-glucosaminide N-acetyltransferase domain-containing protein n=1 Tax=Paludisphaera rhizosphaerae TaxID=2711216 RepID=UPI001F10AFB1|nr:heparan-alpha-glucosaminide N-acetyltransferase domain-containing protein [Paludisphaera rhizosphaerae]
MSQAPTSPRGRIESLDQFRGYTVAAMLFVNFVGGLTAFHATFKHHRTYCSYADTIMPHFFFAVGFAYRLTYLRRLATVGRREADWAVVRRALGLVLLGFVIYHLDGEVKSWEALRKLGPSGFFSTAFKRSLCQTLVQIGLTSVWILPVVAASTRARVIYLIFGAVLHLGLSAWFWLDFAWNTPVIDGGWLGVLSWAIPMLAGTFAYDAIAARDADGRARGTAIPEFLGWGAVLMLSGYLLSCVGGIAPPPFTPPAEGAVVDLWTMSQRTGSVSYQAFAAGFSLAVYALFVAACDVGGLSAGVFRTFGTNALAAYIVHPMVEQAVRPYLPKDAPLWYAAAGTALYFVICWGLIRYLEKNRIFLKI